MTSEIDESAILDEMIEDLRERARDDKLELDERLKLNASMMNLIKLRRKERSKKGRGFDLGQER